jgi:hypothetical protein
MVEPTRPTLPTPPISYEPPRIDRVFTPQDLEREILYAGVTDGKLISGPN